MSSQKKSEMAGAAPPIGRPGASRAAGSEEKRLLAFVSEEGAMTVPQLGRLLRVSESDAASRVEELVELGWMRCRAIPGWKDPWVWLRGGGYKRAGTGFQLKEVRTGHLVHRHAIVEARLALRDEFPAARWVCERELWRERRGDGVIPDGLLIGDGWTAAVEVELSVKSVAKLQEMMAARCEVFDRVIYFCPPVVAGRLRAVRESVEGAGVVVRDLAGSHVASPVARHVRCVFEPEERELVALRLICEEGLVAVAQIGLLLGTDPQEGVALAARLEERNFVRRSFDAGDGGWLHVTRRVADLLGTGLKAFRPFGPSSLQDRLVLARIRADWCAQAGGRRWETRRMLLRGLPGPRRADVPAAVAVSDLGRFAVMLVRLHVKGAELGRDLSVFGRDFDGVMCFAEEATMGRLPGYVEDLGLRNVEFAPMP